MDGQDNKDRVIDTVNAAYDHYQALAQ
jgi:hypothetical protein